MKKTVIEVTAHVFEYNSSLTPEENDVIKHYGCLSVAESQVIRRDFYNILNHCGILKEVAFHHVDNYFSVCGYIPDDVVNMLEDVLCQYCNDEVDKLDYAIGEIYD